MDRNFLVTGAGSGIGRAIAEKIAKEGHRVILMGRTPSKLEATQKGLVNSSKHTVAPCSVTDGAALKAALQEANLGEAGLSGVVANAGVGGCNQYGEGDRWEELLSINHTGSYRTAHEALPYLRKATGCRSIVFVSSILARLGVPGYSAYCASKAGLLGLMRSLSVELAPEKILVNAICPGWVDTDMAKEGIEGFAEATDTDYESARKQQLDMVPLRRMSTPDEIAEVVCFLMDGRQTSITGQALDVNNGALMPA